MAAPWLRDTPEPRYPLQSKANAGGVRADTSRYALGLAPETRNGPPTAVLSLRSPGTGRDGRPASQPVLRTGPSS